MARRVPLIASSNGSFISWCRSAPRSAAGRFACEPKQNVLDFFAVMDLKTREDLLHVITRRVERQSKRTRDFLIAFPVRKQQRHFALLR